MPDITPNPDTTLVQAGGYNFGKRLRQPGGRRLQSCLPSQGAQGAPACECYVFNNWGRPETILLSFGGFPPPGSTNNCQGLNAAAIGGNGPFTLTFAGVENQYLSEATGEWTGGGTSVGGSGVGYSCEWQIDSLPPGDVCNPSGFDGNTSASCRIGWDTLAGVFVEVTLFGRDSGITYYSWTWTKLPITPGQLDCSGNAPLQIDRYCGGFDSSTAENYTFVDGTSGKNTGSGVQPNTYWSEYHAPAGCGGGWTYLCWTAGNTGQSVPSASVAVSCCCWDDAEKKCLCGGGTNEVAPPCCCGDTKDPPPGQCYCLWLCLDSTVDSNCTASIELCRQPGDTKLEWSGGGTTHDGATTISATFAQVDDQWQLSLSCAEPITFASFPSVGRDPIKPSGGSPVDASGCCGSGQWNVSLSCTPQPCPGHMPPICACLDSPPAEMRITLPALGYIDNIICPCHDSAQYAGEYVLQLAGLNSFLALSPLAAPPGAAPYPPGGGGALRWGAWIPGHCGKPDDQNTGGYSVGLPCKFYYAGSAQCPKCTPQAHEVPGGTVYDCDHGYYNPCGPAYSLLEFWLWCAQSTNEVFYAAARLSIYLQTCGGDDGVCGNGRPGSNYCLMQTIDWAGGPVAIDLKQPCCPQIKFGLPLVGYAAQVQCPSNGQLCNADGTTVAAEAVCQ